jgi:hypothetical protein
MQMCVDAKKGRWIERVAEVLAETDQAIPPKYKAAYRRLVHPKGQVQKSGRGRHKADVRPRRYDQGGG